MNGTHLSNRLQTVAQFVLDHARLADIGSDHAYLPVYLANEHRIDFAIAGEVAKGPHDNASQEIQRAGVSTLVASRLADGLLAVMPTDQIDTVVIAGMGGTLITTILTTGFERLSHHERLILQPNVGEDNVRRWLQAHDYQITTEQILEEDGHIYEIIVGDPVVEPVTYSEQELLFGPFLIRDKSPVFVKKWQREAGRLQTVIETMRQAQPAPVAKIQKFEQRLRHILEVIK
ncbi:tRNA (adenine(22)-N(1))-methyltransferase [Secundilactobacillus kimchicus]|uniref:tRNA (adenine(22)-N(1))-methyltransferase n=1 Tax=Secundilactobacillus kimchicus TaxID=528209 RepID=UPI0024A8EBEB|nr:tRNA (adenine(22)-N(1))-methyltransferase TrmK [Secundilactobacillus kimchicus]